MKYFLTLVFSVLACIGVSSAQTSESFAPSKGAWSLGYQTSVFDGEGIDAQNGISAKYLISDKWALRVSVAYGRDYAKGISPEFISSPVVDDSDYDDWYDDNWGDNSNDNEYGQSDSDKTSICKSNFMISIGAERRHNLSKRFVGYYGLDFGFGKHREVCKRYKHGNILTGTDKQNNYSTTAIQPFIGLEYFVAQHVSIGLEAGYNIYSKSYKNSTYTSNNNTQEVYQNTSKASQTDMFKTARLAFYF